MRAPLGAALVVLLTACSGGPAPPPVESAPLAATLAPSAPATASPARLPAQTYSVPSGMRPHDVAPAVDGGVWFAAQGSGELGWLDPATGEVRRIFLGRGSAPHGVIVGPDSAPWITDSGLNAILRVDPATNEVKRFAVPRPNVGLNTAAFDRSGVLWFTGQSGGVVGRLDPRTGEMRILDAPRGAGPYGIAATPSGDVYFASLAGSYLGRVDVRSGAITVLEPPTRSQGARRVWSDSKGRLWVSEWNVGQLAMYDPATSGWQEWKLPGTRGSPYAVYVDDLDAVWLSDFATDSLLRFDAVSQSFTQFPLAPSANVRQLLGRPGEVWGAESGRDALVVVRRG